jgi:hypothetical protein
MQGSLTPLTKVNGDGGGVVPPEFVRHSFEEVEGCDLTVEDRFGAFGGQSDGEGSVGETPGDHENGDEFSAFGKVDVDVAEVGFTTAAGEVIEGHEGFALIAFSLLKVSSNLVVATPGPVFGHEPASNILGCVALVSRGVLIGEENGINAGLKGSEDGGFPRLGRGARNRLGGVESLANGIKTEPSCLAICRALRSTR